MPSYTFDPETDGVPTEAEQAAQAQALEKGEELAKIQAEDKDRRMQQIDESNDLIGGKFKSQDDLLKAYNELQKKLGSEAPAEESEQEVDSPEGGVEEQETEEVEATPAAEAIKRASAAYEESGELSEESLEELSKMDSKDLIKAYVESYRANAAAVQQATIAQSEVDTLMASAGGVEQYNAMIGWAADNFSAEEIGAFNQATQNAASARFAIEALRNRYTAVNGSEPSLITGKAAAPGVQPYRSNAELARDISDPRYHTDPAFRADVEARLSRSQDLL